MWRLIITSLREVRGFSLFTICMVMGASHFAAAESASVPPKHQIIACFFTFFSSSVPTKPSTTSSTSGQSYSVPSASSDDSVPAKLPESDSSSVPTGKLGGENKNNKKQQVKDIQAQSVDEELLKNLEMLLLMDMLYELDLFMDVE